MKITNKTTTPFPQIQSSKKSLKNLSPDSDLFPKSKPHRQPRRKPRSPAGGVRFKRDRPPASKRSRPGTPLLKWKFDEREKEEEERPPPEFGRREVRRREREPTAVSARKLAAVLWRLQLPEATIAAAAEKSSQLKKEKDRLGFQDLTLDLKVRLERLVVPGRWSSSWDCALPLEMLNGASHIGLPFLAHQNSRPRRSEAKDLDLSPRSVSGPRNGFLCKFEPTFQFSNSGMEGATKWDPICLKTSDEVQQIYGHSKHPKERGNPVPAISVMEVELEQARARVHDLETEKRSSKKKLEHFLKKLSEERAAWRSREHEKIRAIIEDIKADLNRERKNRQRLEIVNTKLVNELTEAKVSAKRYMQDYEKERKARELIEEVCDELAKEIGEDKAEVEELKRESMKLREEVDDERRMLQMAEVWREERVQMKLIDAKVMIEDKFSQMKRLVADLETFLTSRSGTLDVEEMRQAEFLRQAASFVNIQDIRDFKYEAPNPDDIFSVFEDVNFGGGNEREVEQCDGYSPPSHASKVHTVSPEANVFDKKSVLRHSNDYIDQSGDEEDESGWETVTHMDDQGSSYSPNGSDPSVNKIRRYSNVSESRTEWEGNGCQETPVTEIREVCAAPKSHLKKVTSISRLWRSGSNNSENVKIVSGEQKNGRLSNGRLSNGVVVSPDGYSGKGGIIAADLMGQWSSPESGNPHITRAMKGCIEWPRGVQKSSSLKAKLVEAKMESQKIQLKHILKQKI
ncbi:hypothetical protein RHMOL_Rhmol06G0297100 [Rhododendron molle]|uniref:Uncharacterized protein n=1 Tax=Rhododendron molle TaxID=49168 RepID=A0ACC0NJ86_RHOML|nr:hypothetical protein RHMOL_Rhmol06G0297100 [Rhododendron molle]